MSFPIYLIVISFNTLKFILLVPRYLPMYMLITYLQYLIFFVFILAYQRYTLKWTFFITWRLLSINVLHFDLLKNHWAKMDQTQMWLLEWSSSKIESGDLAWHLKWPWPLCLLVESLDTCRILVSVLARIWK